MESEAPKRRWDQRLRKSGVVPHPVGQQAAAAFHHHGGRQHGVTDKMIAKNRLVSLKRFLAANPFGGNRGDMIDKAKIHEISSVAYAQ